MSKRHYGILHGRSCLPNLLSASEQWTRALDKKTDVDVIYFNLEQSSWIQSFLTKRTLRVKVGEEYSKCIYVTSGVPQGSALGPVLFLLCINDCLNGLSCDAVMFADDVKIWRTIEIPFNVQSLQNDVDYLSSWSQGALMSLNTDKYAVLRLHPRQARENNVQYQLNGEHLRSVSHQRDLGVIVNETLKPHRQCPKSAKSANSIMRTI